MGAWGTAIFSDDIACDIRDEYRDLIGDGRSGEEATKFLMKNWEEQLDDLDIMPVFWLALAATQWKIGRLEPWVKEKALQIIDSGADLERWEAEGDAKTVKKRQEVLNKLREQLNQPQREPTKISKRFKSETDLVVGDAISYRLLSGQYVIFRVIGHHTDAGGITPICELCKWVGTEIPSNEEIGVLKYLSCGQSNHPYTQFFLGQLKKKEYPNERTQLVAKGVRVHQKPYQPVIFLWGTLDEQLQKLFDLS